MDRNNISSGSMWELTVGYSRAVQIGNQVFVSGTTATDESGVVVGVNDAYKQTRFILKKIESALGQAGANMKDVVRTRMFVTDILRWEEIGKAHGEFFKDIRPASTMVEVSRLIDPDHLVEIEVDAVVSQKPVVADSL